MRKRVAVSLALWLFCLPALGLSLGMAIGSGHDVVTHLDDLSGSWLEAYRTGAWGVAPLVVVAALVPHAWVCLLAMTVAWISQRRLSRWWPVSGTVAAVLGLLALSVSLGPAGILMGVLYASPGMLFAAFLCRFHLAPASPS